MTRKAVRHMAWRKHHSSITEIRSDRVKMSGDVAFIRLVFFVTPAHYYTLNIIFVAEKRRETPALSIWVKATVVAVPFLLLLLFHPTYTSLRANTVVPWKGFQQHFLAYVYARYADKLSRESKPATHAFTWCGLGRRRVGSSIPIPTYPLFP